LGKTIDSNIIGLNETVKAAQNNFLLKGYFNKKKKAATKKKEESEKIEDNKNEK
jgi:phospholipid/cholesterol/gamma-HCH transport system substrate-binding protein